MPRKLLHSASTMSLCSLFACAGASHGVGDATDGTTQADTGAQPPTGTGSSGGSVEESSGPDEGSLGSTSSSTDGNTGPSVTTSGGGDDTTTGEVLPLPWCGFGGSGQRDLEDGGPHGFLPLQVHLGGPIALPLWYYDDGDGRGLRAAVYDTATATWGDTVTLDVGGEVDLWGDATGAVDAQGNAVVVSADNLGGPAVRVHRYDVATAGWTTSILDGDFSTLKSARVTVDADGDAIVLAENEIQLGVSTFALWFYDVAFATWTAPEVIGPIQAFSASASWAQDRDSGDAAFLMDVTGDILQLRHWSAANGEWTMQDVDTSGQSYVYPVGVVSIGNGRFVAVTRSGNFGADDGRMTGFVFEDGEWQSATVLDSGIDASNAEIIGDQDGRVLVTWNAHPTSIRARTYDPVNGWSPMHVVNAGQVGRDYVVYTRGALDPDGSVVGWSQLNDTGFRTYVRRLDGDGWSPIVDVDPEQPALSQITALHGIAADNTRIVWARDMGNANYTGWYYACRAPDGEWSAPSSIDVEQPRFQAHPSGEFLAVGWDGNSLVAEYFSAL